MACGKSRRVESRASSGHQAGIGGGRGQRADSSGQRAKGSGRGAAGNGQQFAESTFAKWCTLRMYSVSDGFRVGSPGAGER